MAANYTSGITSTEENYLLFIDDFLQNHVGWYRVDTIADSGTNRDYVFISDGEPDQYENTNPRYIRLRATGGFIQLYTYETYTNSSTHTGQVADATNGTIRDVSGTIMFQLIADKERLMLTHKTTDILSSTKGPSYLGRVQSLYNAEQHPYPNMIKGAYFGNNWWGGTGTADRSYAISPTGTQRYYWIWNLADLTNASNPSHRNGKYLALPSVVYSPENSFDYDILGHARGAYQVSKYIPTDAYITLASGTHKVWTDNGKVFTNAFGPLTDPRIGDVNRVPPPFAQVDYDYRGFQTNVNTLANWRLDSEDSGFYEDQTGDYNFTPVNSPTLVNSPLVRAVTFNGTTQRASSNGDASAATALTGEWTCELMFNPSTIPGSGRDTLIEFGTDTEGTEAENTLLSISLTPSGNINVLWERDIAGTNESNTTTSDFILEDRWNYLAIVKKDVGGSNYDIQVWHSSFGDHNPVLRETFSSVSNSTGGASSSWFLATDSSITDFYEGSIDAVRIQKEALTEEQIKSSLYRVRL